jgi:hypothetical protein
MAFETRVKVVRRKKTVPEDYGYVGTREVHYQELVLLKTCGGDVVSTTVVDTEEVPEHAIIDLGCFGATNWRSKWADVFPEAYQ